MIPLADTHVHLLAGLDDGPETRDQALAMCRLMVAEGVRHATALAHQHDGYPHNTAEYLREAALGLAANLISRGIPLNVYPTGEIMLVPSLVQEWKAGNLLSVGDHGQWLLVEMPHGAFVDVLPLAEELRPLGLRLIIAHAERYGELLHEPALAARWVAAGCLIQVTANVLADPWDAATEKALRTWATGGFIHLLGSDGHGIDWRRPVMAAGVNQLARWVGRRTAERIAGLWGVAVLQGLPIEVPPPRPPTRSWFARLFGA